MNPVPKQRPDTGHVRRGDMADVAGLLTKIGRKIGALSDVNQAFKDTFNKPTYYHGTFADYDAVDPNMVDLGTHVGSEAQAESRIKDLIEKAANDGRPEDFLAESAKVMPLKVKANNPLEMRDVGMWNDSEQVFTHLEERATAQDRWGNPSIRGFGRDEKLVKALSDFDYDGLQESFEDFMLDVGDRNLWQKSPENRRFLDKLRDAVKDAGYDSIKYKNFVERDSMDALVEDSFIVLDPKNIRSVDAAFDPEKSGSSNLLYSLPASGMLGYGALNELGGEDGQGGS